MILFYDLLIKPALRFNSWALKKKSKMYIVYKPQGQEKGTIETASVCACI